MNTNPRETRKLFRKLGTCSQLLCHILNREFGRRMEPEERATDPLAGGILRRGYQCGMLWGSTLAVGTEAFRRSEDRDQAIAMAIEASRHILGSFVARTGSASCREITGCDFDSRISTALYLITGKFRTCFRLAEQWAPEALAAAEEGLAASPAVSRDNAASCTSEVVRRMGATDEQIVMVAGFAGGIGLSGNACGALAAAIWLGTLAWGREHPGKSGYANSYAKAILEAFRNATGGEFLCHRIAGRRFESVADHTGFLREGGCKNVIDSLARSTDLARG